jgi:hypothetical protein
MTVGYGDTGPVTNNEKMYVACAMIIGAGYYAYTLNSISVMVQNHNLSIADYKEKMVYVN